MKKTISIILIIISLFGFGILDLGFADDLSAEAIPSTERRSPSRVEESRGVEGAKAEYRLASGDQLEIKIINQSALDTKQTIAPDGSISLPLLGRVIVQGQTLEGINSYLVAEFSKYFKNPQVVVYLTPRPIYVVQHDLKKNTWEVKEAKSIEEARAYLGPPGKGDYRGLKHGDIITAEVGKKPDWWEDNWYKVVTAVAVAAGVYSTLNR